MTHLLIYLLMALTPAPLPQPAEDEVSFQEDVLPLLQSSCANKGCHDGTVLPMLDTYRQVKAERRMIARRIQDTRSPMPPRHAPRKLSVEERQLIINWIAAGAPDN